MSNSPKNLLDGLGERFRALEVSARAVTELTEKVRAGLDTDLKKHLISASYRKDSLVLLTDSAAWCTRLRFVESEIRSQLAAAGEPPFARLRVRVVAPVRRA